MNIDLIISLDKITKALERIADNLEALNGKIT